MDTVPLDGRAARRLTDAPDPASGPVTAAEDWPDDLVALYEARRLSLVRLAYVLTSDREVAEEVVQDAFLSVRPRWDDITDPPSYLRTAVVNRCRSWLRRQRTARAHLPDRTEAAALGADELWDALARLDERRYTAIVLRFYEDLSEGDIARILECRPATVRTLVRRGLAALREEIEP